MLAKFFKLGDHVKVVGGARHVGETGMVIRVGDDAPGKGAVSDVLYVVSDLTQEEFQVKAGLVSECLDVSSGLERIGRYELHDLVDLPGVTCNL